MDGPRKISDLMTYLNITEDELFFHLKAHQELSLNDSDRLLKGIPQETRAKMTKFYRMLRDDGVYYTPGQKPQKICTYIEGWKNVIEKDPRSHGEKLSLGQVSNLLKETIKEIFSNIKRIA